MFAHIDEMKVENLLSSLFLPENRELLESYRLRGSRNKVYRVPLDPEDDDFLIVKMPPNPVSTIFRRARRIPQNFIYGEHTTVIGKEVVELETARFKEWEKEGILVPRLFDTSIPNARVFEGLPFPPFDKILSDETITSERKLEILGCVSRELSIQHKAAYRKGRLSLVHPEPAPWNVMFDMDRDLVYWIDLEHPAEYPGMSFDSLVVRGFRWFVFGVLYNRPDQFDETIEAICQNYDLDIVMERFADLLEKSSKSPLGRAVRWARRGTVKGMLRVRIAPKIRECLAKKRGENRDSAVRVTCNSGVANEPGDGPREIRERPGITADRKDS